MKLVLVGGTGRSGTSLVYYRLLLNKEVCGYPEFESGLFSMNDSLLDVCDVYVNTYSPDRFDQICEVFKYNVQQAFDNISLGGLISSKIRFKPNRMVSRYIDTFVRGLKNDRLSGSSYMECFRQRSNILLVQLFKYNSSRSNVLLEKTPHNVLHFKRIKDIFPEAKMLHIVRDPRAVAESVVRQQWGASSYKEAVIWVKLILETWIQQYENHEFDIESCRCIRVEDLVAGYEEKEKMVRDFVGEKLENMTLYANPDALDGWRKNISDDDFDYANQELNNVMQFFSYIPDLINSKDQALNTKLRIK